MTTKTALAPVGPQFPTSRINATKIRRCKKYENHFENRQLIGLLRLDYNRPINSQTGPLLRAWLAGCPTLGLVSCDPDFPTLGRWWVDETWHWLAGCFPLHSKQTCLYWHPLHCLLAWNVQHVPLGNLLVEGQKRTRALALSPPVNDGVLPQKLDITRSHNSQWIWSQG